MGTDALPGLGATTRPAAKTASLAWNQPFCPRYQMATQPPRRSAMAYCCPSDTRLPTSLTSMVCGVPLGCRPMSVSSGELSSGWECSTTSLAPLAGQGVPALTQPVNGTVLVAMSGWMVSMPNGGAGSGSGLGAP